MLIPLITYPYLIRVLGIETYGRVVFAQAIVGYLLILVEFGFNISATKEVSIYRNNKKKLSEIVSSILLIKSGLFIISAFILVLLIFFIPQAQNYKTLFFLTLWMCLYNVIFPIWYFQGIEQMKYITYITLVSRLTFLGLIFVFIHDRSDYLFVPIINGIGALLAGLISLYVVFVKQQLKFRIQPCDRLQFYFKDSFPIFISNLSTTLYVTTNKVILGAFMGMKEVAYYDLAEKLSSVLKMPIQIIGQTIYPKIAQGKDLRFLLKLTKFILIVALLILFAAFVSSKTIIEIIGGKEMLQSMSIFRILITSIIPVSVSLIFANLVLISWGYNKIYLKLRLITNSFYILIVFAILFIGNLSIIDLAVLSVLTEIVAAVLSIYYCNSLKILNCNVFLKFKKP